VTTPLVRLHDTSFRYAGAEHAALSGVTLGIAPGEVVGLAGPPGSGTSTLLLVLGGYAPRLVGGTLTGERQLNARQPAIVFATPWTQLTGLCGTVAAEVAFGPASYGLPREAIRENVTRQLDRLGVTHLAERDPATLSGGELQRVIVASALALAPDLLLLDDPAAELDPAGADALYALLRELAAGGATVVVATPDTARAARVASRVIVLDQGRVAADGPPAELPA
jgi:energy-coupling factor transporter ATP-binding protein EcfA2